MAGEKVCHIAATEGRKSIDLVVANVENEFVGISMTESCGLEMRRIAAEIHDVRDVVRLRDSLNAYLVAVERKEAR